MPFKGVSEDGHAPVRADLADLAKTSVESLAGFDNLTGVKSSGIKLKFGAPLDYWLDWASGALALASISKLFHRHRVWMRSSRTAPARRRNLLRLPPPVVIR